MSWMDKGDWKPSTTGPNPCDEIQLGPAESCRLEIKKRPKMKNSTLYWFAALIFAALTAVHWVAFPFSVVFLVISHRFYNREITNSRD